MFAKRARAVLVDWGGGDKEQSNGVVHSYARLEHRVLAAYQVRISSRPYITGGLTY